MINRFFVFLFFIVMVVSQAGLAEAPVPLLIDADTANEIDDLYAITRALLEPKFTILGLSSAQWNHRLSPSNTVEHSQKLNEDILRLLNRVDIPHPMGSEMIMGKPWGGTEPRDSSAAQLMIRTARNMPEGKKLIVASLGAVTNVASAIKLSPDIIPKIACYFLSARYFSDRNVWDKDEFNCRNDLNAANFLFNTDGLEIHLMPVNILYDYKYSQEKVLRELSPRGGIWDYLATRWLTHSPNAKQWIMWDLALIQALANPALAEEGLYNTPPENQQRKIYVYTKIDIEAMKSDWWAMVEKAGKK
jgi:inosine-uridine nucleoside N-ribohydrolase